MAVPVRKALVADLERILLALAFWLGLAAGPLQAADDWIERLGLLQDPAANFTPDSVRAGPFQSYDHQLALGFSRAAHWVRVELRPSAVPLLLSIEIPNLDHVRLLRRDKAGVWHTTESGDTVPYAERPWRSPFLAFRIEPEQTGQPLYLRILTTGTTGINIAARPIEQGLLSEHRHMILDAAIFGLVLMAIALCLLLYAVSRQRIFLGFCLTQMLWLAAAVTFNGYTSVLLPGTPTDRIYSVLGSASFLVDMFFHIALVRRFRPAAWAFWTATGVAVLGLFAVPILFFQDVMLAMQFRTILSAIFVVLMAVMAWTAKAPSVVSVGMLRTVYSALVLSICIWLLPMLGWTAPLSISFQAIMLQGTVNLALIMAMLAYQTLRERRLAEVASERMREAETERRVQSQSLEAQRNLTWMLSHEVGTSLAIIRLALTRETISDRNARRIDKAINGLDRVIRHCLDTDRIQAGQLAISPRKLDLTEVVLGLREQFHGQRRIADDGLQEPIFLTTDPDLIRVTLTHILENAIKYSPEDTPIQLQIAPLADRAGVRITVRNERLAGPAPDAGRVFDKFYRDPHVLATSGSGLGLFIVRQVAKALGGSARFQIEDDFAILTLDLPDLTGTPSDLAVPRLQRVSG